MQIVASGLGPEVFVFDETGNPTLRIDTSRQYSLRPGVVESYYYLWKVTGDEKYRDWAWEAVQVTFLISSDNWAIKQQLWYRKIKLNFYIINM